MIFLLEFIDLLKQVKEINYIIIETIVYCEWDYSEVNTTVIV